MLTLQEIESVTKSLFGRASAFKIGINITYGSILLIREKKEINYYEPFYPN